MMAPVAVEAPTKDCHPTTKFISSFSCNKLKDFNQTQSASYQLYIRLSDLDEKPQMISRYLTRSLHNSRILYVMARAGRNFGSSRFGLEEDLKLIIFAKMMSSL
jgi:hypothetical protein